MAPKPDRRGLGRGLSALMADADLGPDPTEPARDGAHRRLPIEQVVPNPDQPRRQFTQEALDELAASIRARGVLQPLIVRPHPDEPGLYQLVAGERRWRASQLAQQHEVPVIIRDFSDDEMLEVAIVENIQRAELNAIEEAAAYRQLMERFAHTQEQLAEALHKSRAHVANHLRLLTLPEPVQAHVRDGQLSAGHARALITAPDPVALARRVIERGLSVRDTEALVRSASQPRGPRTRPAPKDADTRALEGDLSAHLRMRVSIDTGAQGGKLTISWRDLDQLDRLVQILAGG